MIGVNKENGTITVTLCQVFAGLGSMQTGVYSKRINYVGHVQVIHLNTCEHCIEYF